MSGHDPPLTEASAHGLISVRRRVFLSCCLEDVGVVIGVFGTGGLRTSPATGGGWLELA